MSYKSTDGLMRHLRRCGIDIGGSTQKRQLSNTGYYHGYKGYRFFGSSTNRLPFSNFKDIYATIQYDTKLKPLLYSQLMFIETAVKNVALNSILCQVGSESIQDMYDKVLCCYQNSPVGCNEKQKREFQEEKIKLQDRIQHALLTAYQRKDAKITHFYNHMNYNSVPIWALFEILDMGNFGSLLQCLTKDAREQISRELGLNLGVDTNRELIYKYIFALKDLRNAVAHNAVIYDTRFRKSDPSPAMSQCLCLEVGLSYVNFKTLGDYIILICYFLKLLGVSKTEIRGFLREFRKLTSEYKIDIDPQIAIKVIHPDFDSRMEILKNYI